MLGICQIFYRFLILVCACLIVLYFLKNQKEDSKKKAVEEILFI